MKIAYVWVVCQEYFIDKGNRATGRNTLMDSNLGPGIITGFLQLGENLKNVVCKGKGLLSSLSKPLSG